MGWKADDHLIKPSLVLLLLVFYYTHLRMGNLHLGDDIFTIYCVQTVLLVLLFVFVFIFID